MSIERPKAIDLDEQQRNAASEEQRNWQQVNAKELKANETRAANDHSADEKPAPGATQTEAVNRQAYRKSVCDQSSGCKWVVNWKDRIADQSGNDADTGS